MQTPVKSDLASARRFTSQPRDAIERSSAARPGSVASRSRAIRLSISTLRILLRSERSSSDWRGLTTSNAARNRHCWRSEEHTSELQFFQRLARLDNQQCRTQQADQQWLEHDEHGGKCAEAEQGAGSAKGGSGKRFGSRQCCLNRKGDR